MSQTFKTLMSRLARAGYGREFVQTALLPDWWDETSANDPALLPEIEIRVARFLGRSVASLNDPHARLAPPSYPQAKLRRVRDIDRDRLAPAIHAATRVAAAVVRNLRPNVSGVRSTALPTDGARWRAEISPGAAPTLTDVVVGLWRRGIPVVPLEQLPAPGFQGIACIVEDRPVLLLAYRHDEPGRVAFLLAHEAGHVAAGDCAPNVPVIDQEDEIDDDAEIERRADLYATFVLVGDSVIPRLEGTDLRDFKDLARRASEIERQDGADASAVIFAWARRTGDYMTASRAVKALYRATGARRLLRQQFDLHVDTDDAPETDRGLLRCVYSATAVDEADH